MTNLKPNNLTLPTMHAGSPKPIPRSSFLSPAHSGQEEQPPPYPPLCFELNLMQVELAKITFLLAFVLSVFRRRRSTLLSYSMYVCACGFRVRYIFRFDRGIVWVLVMSVGKRRVTYWTEIRGRGIIRKKEMTRCLVQFRYWIGLIVVCISYCWKNTSPNSVLWL